MVSASTPLPKDNVYSIQDDVNIGMKMFEDAPIALGDRKNGVPATIFDDTILEEYLDGLGRQILNVAPEYAKVFRYRFKVFDAHGDGDIKAIAFPGGIILVSVDVLRFAPSDDFVAVVLAHEMAHPALRHATFMKSNDQLQEFAFEFLMKEIRLKTATATGQEIAELAFLARKAFLNRVGERYALLYKNELDADVWSARMAHKAGFNLTSYANLQRERSKTEPLGTIDGADHPPSALRALIAECTQKDGRDSVSLETRVETPSPELLRVKERIRELTKK